MMNHLDLTFKRRERSDVPISAIDLSVRVSKAGKSLSD
jgi:hypothetical protein